MRRNESDFFNVFSHAGVPDVSALISFHGEGETDNFLVFLTGTKFLRGE